MIDTDGIRQWIPLVREGLRLGERVKLAKDIETIADELDRLYALERELIELKKKIKADKAPPKCEFCGKFSNDLYACDGDEGPDACLPCRKKYREEFKK